MTPSSAPPFDIRAALAEYQRAAIAVHGDTLTGRDLRADTARRNEIAAQIVAEFERLRLKPELLCECGHPMSEHDFENDGGCYYQHAAGYCKCPKWRPVGGTL